MPLSRVIPALADLTQDIAGPLPLALLQDWATGQQDLDAAESLLTEFRREGVVVCSDTSGLSQLTHDHDVLEVMWWISRPKGIVHALGTEIGGRPIGVWVADNTEMLYPTDVEAGLILDALNETRSRIARAAPVRLGFCVHSGTFYEIGGGLYGEDASTVELLAEEYAGPDEILVTGPVFERVRGLDGAEFQTRADLAEFNPGGVFRLIGERVLPDLRGENEGYPHPYPEEFFRDLCAFGTGTEREAIRRRVYEKYLREVAVLFVAREQLRAEAGSLPSLLDDLLQNALTDTIIREILRDSAQPAFSGGGLAILTFPSPADAIDTAMSIRARFELNGLRVRQGIDYGSVLLFESARAGITGDPVNLASKLCEDIGEPARIFVTKRAAEQVPAFPYAEPFSAVISRVPIEGSIL